ncbi:MAG: hypothetical protein JO117_07105, partial [Verrucomicrobia bacterium]|nr:hypothetical protein [Verrucomicrobiota bacterium]
GVDLGFFPTECLQAVDELCTEVQQAHLQKAGAQKLGAEERDLLRADVVREKLKRCPSPDLAKVKARRAANENGSGESAADDAGK